MQGFLGFWIGQKKKFPAIEAQRVGQARDDFIGGMTLAALEMAHVGRRGPDSLCDLLLHQFALTSAVTDHLPKLLVQHRHGSPLLASPRKAASLRTFQPPTLEESSCKNSDSALFPLLFESCVTRFRITAPK